jgi:hypothetical protein
MGQRLNEQPMIQNWFAQGDKTKRLVNSLAVLKSLQKAGHITLHRHTGTKVSWYGQETTAWYIDDSTSRSFEHRGRKFTVEYRSGSFNPYVYAHYTEEEIETNRILKR